MVWQVKTEQGPLRDCFSVESACYQRALHGYHRPDLGLSHDLHPSTMHGSGRPSPAPFFGSPFSAQGFGGSGGSVANHLSQYGDAGGQYGQYQPLMTYDTASPSLTQPTQPQSQPQQQQQQQQQPQQHHDVADDGSVGGGEMPPNPHGHWSYPGVPQHHYPPPPHPHHPRMALEDWGQHYLPLQPPPLHPTGGEGGTPPLHPHQQPYNPYGYGRLSLDGYEPQTHGMETSPSSGESSDPSQGGGQGGGSSTKQLRPPFEWMKPANVQPAPGKTRTKDKYRVVYSDHQRLELEKEFHFARYITIRRKAEIASQLNLSERQVKIWFQNRRAKERKQNKKRDEASRRGQTTPGCVPKLEPLDSSPPINGPLHQHCPASSPSMAMGVAQHPILSQSAALNSGMGHPMMNGPTRFPNGGLQNRLSPVLSQGMAGMPHEAHVSLQQTAAPGTLAPTHPSAGHLHLNHSIQLHPVQNGPVGKPGYEDEDV